MDQPQAEIPALPPGVNSDEAALRLMSLAESFRTRRTPKYKLAIKCLMAAHKIPCSIELSARVGLETGKLLWYYTKNVTLARFHLENSYKKFKEIKEKSDTASLRLQTVCMIGEIYLEERCYETIRIILLEEIETAKKFPRFQAKMLFILTEVYIKTKEFEKALEIVKQGAAFFQQANEVVLVCYFGLIKCLIYSIQSHQYQMELGESVAELGELLNKVPAEASALEDIRAFCYSIQLSFFLAAGFFTNSKKCLQQLHLTVQLASKKENEMKPHFRWLSSEMLTAIAYVLTVLTNIQFNNTERAKRYFHTSIKHFEALRSNWNRAHWPVIERSYEQLTDQLEIIVYEAIAPTFLIIGHPEDCLSYIQQMKELISKNSHLIQDFNAQFHCILGTYAAYFCDTEAAKTHFTLAAKSSVDQDLVVFSYLSLGLVYLYAGNRVEYYNAIDKMSNGSFAKNTRALISLVNAANTYLQDRVDECKQYIGQCLNISQEAEMGKIQALASLLLSTLVKGDEDAMNVGISWAEKLGDVSLRLWGCYQKCEQLKKANDTQNYELKMTEVNELKQLLEANRQKAKSMPEHNQLLNLTDLNAEIH